MLCRAALCNTAQYTAVQYCIIQCRIHADTQCRRVNEESVLAVQIFDQKKFKKKDQGFLGVINVRVGSVIDLDAGGDGT